MNDFSLQGWDYRKIGIFVTKWIYSFGNGSAEGNTSMRDLLGGKGANLAEMSAMNLPVPPGFTITTSVCTHYYNHEKTYPKSLKAQVHKAIDTISEQVGRTFGTSEYPLLLSVRSGSRASMPGMMDTVLNLGLNDASVEILADHTGDHRFAYDSYRRFIQMYSDVVLNVDHDLFEEIIDDIKAKTGKKRDTNLSAEEWKQIVDRFKQLIEKETGSAFPQDPHKQIWGAISAVFASWMNRRAIIYRSLHNIPENWGTAVNIQAMVFGNMGKNSATGVAFTRNPSTGENELYGEFLVNAQGEDVVAGIRTPQNLTERARIAAGSEKASLEKLMPESFADFCNITVNLEKHFCDMQDIEFTIEQGKLWLLQTRSGKRTAKAALRMAVEMVDSGLISREQAILRIDPLSLDQLLHPTIAPLVSRDIIARGLPASPGAATGQIVFSSHEAEEMNRTGTPVILVRMETSPEDIHGMHAAQGILTARGGMTSHAAVVARGMGKPCVCGAIGIHIDYYREELSTPERLFSKGDIITIDGSVGQILAGSVSMLQPELSGYFATIMEWADKVRRMGVRANAETPAEAKAARSFGAEGIGLCRTEHMFFDAGRILSVREMILAETEFERREALAKLLPMQRSDFVELFKIMSGLPITIRLLDPPLHEFLPHTIQEIQEVASVMSIDPEKLRQRTDALRESNPMLGHRGCRLAISYPEIVEMQSRAIFEAMIIAGAETGANVVSEIMVPLIATRDELSYIKTCIDQVAVAVQAESGQPLSYRVGTMIELPRAALTADKIAEFAEFFSFGTNDLTQTVFGISRDDAAGFLGTYRARGVIEVDPFVSIDVDGVGALMKIATEKGRKARTDLKLGICGEHGGDPDSIQFCETIGLDYVSCSPFRVPVARLTSAQVVLKANGYSV